MFAEHSKFSINDSYFYYAGHRENSQAKTKMKHKNEKGTKRQQEHKHPMPGSAGKPSLREGSPSTALTPFFRYGLGIILKEFL